MNLLDRIVNVWKAENPAESLPEPKGLDRRRFLKILGGSAAVAAAAPLLDLEALVWTPTRSIVIVEGPPVFLTADLITREALRILENNLSVVKCFDRLYDERFVGDKIGVRLAGTTMTDHIGVDIDTATMRGKRPMKEWRERVIKPAVQEITRRVGSGPTVFGELSLPRGVYETSRATASSGASVRATKAFNVWDGLDVCRVDVLVGKA